MSENVSASVLRLAPHIRFAQAKGGDQARRDIATQAAKGKLQELISR